MATGNISEDLMTNILSRLSGKSLVRFRCVHSTWSHLFKSSYFITTHLQNLNNNKDRGFILALHKVPDYIRGLATYGFRLLSPDTGFYLDLEMPFEYGVCRVDVIGSCNGLVCLSNRQINASVERVVLYNPILKQHKVIPEPSFSHSPQRCVKVFGLGYDSRVNDFKVVWLHHSWHVEVFTLRMNSWRNVESGFIPPKRACFLFCSNNQQCFFNGAINRLVKVNCTNCVLSFDVCGEAFQLFQVPLRISFRCGTILIDVHKDCLCLLDFVSKQDGKWYDIWVMKEYGVEESWTRLHSIELFPRGLIERISWKFLGIGIDGELFLTNIFLRKRLAIYNTENENFKNVSYPRNVELLSAVGCRENIYSLA